MAPLDRTIIATPIVGEIENAWRKGAVVSLALLAWRLLNLRRGARAENSLELASRAKSWTPAAT